MASPSPSYPKTVIVQPCVSLKTLHCRLYVCSTKTYKFMHLNIPLVCSFQPVISKKGEYVKELVRFGLCTYLTRPETVC